MADLLGKSVQEFLILTQSYTLPYLVRDSKIDVIKKIANASQDDEDYAICMDPRNIVPILALLLVQDVTDPEKYILNLLKPTSPRFKGIDLTDLVRVEPSSLALHLLKAAGDADDKRKGRVCIYPSRLWARVANMS